ncbi:unnamed protein product [Paramecium sonneborni]|uniref:Uncharacterized protein n=1 Tax=Paramecium sonneborni TaxID=65129 RepID=A0A8S1RQJ2_9CILI|nr:unnamed protein product [Paramecium sonneborni]
MQRRFCNFSSKLSQMMANLIMFLTHYCRYQSGM